MKEKKKKKGGKEKGSIRYPVPGSLNCRCNCSSVCSITGANSIRFRSSQTYTVTVQIAGNAGCKATPRKHTDTDWAVSGAGRPYVTRVNPNKDDVTIGFSDRAGIGESIDLKALPKTECYCKGTNATVPCSPSNDRVSIRLVR